MKLNYLAISVAVQRKLLMYRVAFLAMVTMLFTLQLFAQDIQVKGTITNSSGVAVPNASITVKGTTNAVTATDNGDFTISAPGTGTLVITSVGYSKLEIPIQNRTSITVVMESTTSNLNEVVVIGYGTQRKADVTGATVSVKGETLAEIKAPNILNQLQGRAAGVDIVNNGNTIGTGGEIRIRGNRSMTGNNAPLIVVDGMAYGGSLNDIAAENIESLDVLKDASATAIFGSRGSNGVIIITTKRGTNRKAVTTYDGYVGMVQPLGTYRLFNGPEYAQFKADAAVGNSNVPNSNPYALNADEQASLAAGISTDWQDLLLTNGIRTGHDLGVRGGTDKTQYYFGIGYYKETGITRDQNLDRFNFNVNIDHQMSGRIKVGFSSFNTMVYSNRLGTNAYGSGNRLGPLYKPYNDDGTLNFKPARLQGVDDQQINPLTSIGNDDIIKAYQRRYQFQYNLYGELKITEDLKFRTTFGFGWSQQFNSNYTGPNTVFNVNTTTGGSQLSQANSEGWQYTINNSLEYKKTINDRHKIQGLVLQEIQRNQFRQQQFNGTGVPADFMQDYNWQQVNTVVPQVGNFNERELKGYMARAIYGFDDKYLVTATVRTDGSSVLADGNQWVTYPAVSVGWNIDRENFMSNVKFLSSLKLRAGWGISSNQGIDPYTTLGSLSSNFYNYGQGSAIGVNYANGYLINTSPNPNLTWEKTEGLNFGIDFGMFNNRLTGSLEYYDTKTTGILLRKELPRSNGTNSILENVGETASNGFEMTLSSLNIAKKVEGGFTWRTDFNLFFNREKIVALQPGLSRDLGNGWFVGQPITTIFDYKKIGIWQTGEQPLPSFFPGDIKIADISGPDGKPDGRIDQADRSVVGNFQPDFVAGMTNSFAYKNFDLNIVLFGRFGQTVVTNYLSADGGAAGYPFFMNSRVNQMKVNYWTPTNPTNDFPQPDAGRDALLYTSTLTYRDGSFIKIRTIDLGYNLPAKWLSGAKIQGLRIYASAQNPFILWSPLVKEGLGLDPEGNGTGNTVGSQGGGATAVPGRAITVGMGVPPTRQMIVGVNLKF